jgi:hypothetical protein
MSMSEFERLLRDWDDDAFPLPANEQEQERERKCLPDDFTCDDLDFAQELNGLFPLSEEQMPPDFVQTLLAAEDPRLAPVAPGFEEKTCVEVFRRLHLRRQLFHPTRPTFHTLVTALPRSRTLVALIAACLIVMVVTVAMTGNSFASGLNILWSGAHSGVIQTTRYPANNALATTPHAHKQTPKGRHHPTILSLAEAQQQLHFSMYWPSSVPDNYTLQAILLRQGVGQEWADGPILELDYSYNNHGALPHGSGIIVISEFKPLGSVLQVVQLGAAHLIAQNGKVTAIYVDGQWETINQSSHAWVYGERSELIYEHDGVVFWIAGDQRDGIDSNALLQIAESLHVLDVTRITHALSVLVPSENAGWSFGSDVVYYDNTDGLLGYATGDNGPAGTTNQTQVKGGTHSQ